MKKDYCLLCKDNVEYIVVDKVLKYKDDIMDIQYEGKVAICPICGEEIFNDEVNNYNQEKIKETYSIEYEIITKDEINQIIEKYNIGKRPLSSLLGLGEITITRYLDGYVPTPKNSKLLKQILNSPSDYYSFLQMNKKNITTVAFNKSLEKTKTLLGMKYEDHIIEEVSKYIVNKIETTNMGLQKILYYIQMFHMAFYKKHAFNSRCSAWTYGPVFGTIYHKYKKFENGFIIDEMTEIQFEYDIKNTIDNVIKYFGCYTGYTLKAFTHKEQPWLNAINAEDQIIEKSAMKEYGEKILNDYNINNIEEINKYSESMLKKIY